MNSQSNQKQARTCHAVAQRKRSFTLIELMVVIAVIVILTVLLVPAFTNLKGSGDITNAAYTITGALEQARNYAMANNTFVWVGFYEEAPTTTSPTNATPPYPGKGRLIVAMVASKDGTTNCQDPASNTSTRIPLTASQITQTGKLIKIENIHMTDIGPPPPPTLSPAPAPAPNSLAARPDLPYSYGSPTADYQNRINSDAAQSPENQTLYPFIAQGYTFYKTVRFNPRGEANINSTYVLRRVAELGLRPTHGIVIDANTANVVAIQFSGVSGNFKIYRQ